MEKETYLEKALAWAEKRATISLKAVPDGYEDPKVFRSTKTDLKIQPDMSFVTHGGSKHFSDIALKNEDDKTLVVRWKLLGFMAQMKRGKLHLLAPRGHKSFTEKLVARHNINAVIHSI
ncbi:hypothetical protein ACWGOQ_0013280 [Aquimarina sp. M1]